jgi:type IV secretory pathway VirB3-like protein
MASFDFCFALASKMVYECALVILFGVQAYLCQRNALVRSLWLATVKREPRVAHCDFATQFYYRAPSN